MRYFILALFLLCTKGIKAQKNLYQDAYREVVKALTLYNEGNLKYTTTKSGLKYHILSVGKGNLAKKGQIVSVEFVGAEMNGKDFDNSYLTDRTIKFMLGIGQTIRGWDEMLTYLNKGAKAIVIIPSKLAPIGLPLPPRVPGNQDVIFYLELKDITEAKK
jgi:FKBP-type peptidyl-prolyl cis-trans isomerase FkpA